MDAVEQFFPFPVQGRAQLRGRVGQAKGENQDGREKSEHPHSSTAHCVMV